MLRSISFPTKNYCCVYIEKMQRTTKGKHPPQKTRSQQQTHTHTHTHTQHTHTQQQPVRKRKKKVASTTCSVYKF